MSQRNRQERIKQLEALMPRTPRWPGCPPLFMGTRSEYAAFVNRWSDKYGPLHPGEVGGPAMVVIWSEGE